MKASSESGLWATWMVVISSFLWLARRGERGIDVVLVEQVFGQRRGALSWFRGEELGVERAGAGVVLLHARRAGAEDETEQMGGAGGEDGVGFGARERGVAADFAEPAQVVALIEVEWGDHLVGGARHGEERLHGLGATGLVLGHDAVVEPFGALLGRHLADVGCAGHP